MKTIRGRGSSKAQPEKPDNLSARDLFTACVLGGLLGGRVPSDMHIDSYIKKAYEIADKAIAYKERETQ